MDALLRYSNEIFNLLHGFLYLVTIPGGYLLLVTYALCNLHVVSWGTRETVEVVKPKPGEKEKTKPGKRKKKIIFKKQKNQNLIRSKKTSKNRSS